MYKAYYGGNYYTIIELPDISDSSRETTFTDLTIDFRGKLESDLPLQFQEIKIYRDLEHISTGYVDSIEFPTFEFVDQPFKLQISLLSPHSYASKRTISLKIDTVPLNVAILDIVNPLLIDGFTLAENTLSSKLVSEIFQAETVEKVLNYLGNKFKFVWYIDKDKQIFLKDIDELIGQVPLVQVMETDTCYLQSVKPTKTVVDYGNKLVIKNAILLANQILVPEGTALINGNTYTFKFPISISENTAYRLDVSGDIMGLTYSFLLFPDVSFNTYVIEIDPVAKTIFTSPEIGFLGEDDENASKHILLERSSDDVTKITGFKWNTTNDTVSTCYSYSGLFPIVATFIDPEQVAQIKTQVNTSGVIEKLIDANWKYFSYDELLEYASNLFTQNNVLTNEVDCVFKGRLDDANFMSIIDKLNITKVFSINLPNFLISGQFIITDREMSSNQQVLTVRVKGRNYNLNEDFNDLYRNKIEQLNEEDLNNRITVLYNQDNKTVLNKEVIVNGVVVNND